MSALKAETLHWMQSLETSALKSLLSKLPKDKAAEAIAALKAAPLNGYLAERDEQNAKQRRERSEAARIEIPDCVNPARREACLADPERFLRTYFPQQYRLQFGKDHRYMIQSVVDNARSGGRQAIAAPRGRGKSEVVKGLTVYVVLAELSRFILAIAATTPLAKRLFTDFKKKLRTNPLLYEDFPEVCHPIRALEGAPQRAAKQHVAGRLTNIVWHDTEIHLPHVAGSPYGGVKMTYAGLDSAFRGANIDGDRPDFAIVDDPETKESAKSYTQIEDRENTLDRDIAGLVAQDGHLAIVVLTTVQTAYSLSARLTDPAIKPAYNGRRFGMIEKWPDNTELWDEYVAIRHREQQGGDRHAIKALQFYEANRAEMDAGVEMISDHYKRITNDAGESVVISAIQQAYNKIADTSLQAYKTEYQNDPAPEEKPEGNGVTAALVGSRISGLARRQLPANTIAVTAAIDLGKYLCHWVIVAWWKGAGGVVVDYGRAEVAGTDNTTDNAASEPMIFRALLRWRDELLAEPLIDATGRARPIDFVLVDSGTFTNAAYEFCRQVGGQFHPSKGIGNYRARKTISAGCIAGERMHAQYLTPSKIWLYDLDADYWKQFVHERFLTPTFDENNMLRAGSLSLFHPDSNKKHLTFSNHIAAEELVTEFKEGKGAKTFWRPVNANNHWLDALSMAAAGTEICKVNLIGGPADPVAPKRVDTDKPEPPRPHKPKPHGKFRTRPGGWIPQRRSH